VRNLQEKAQVILHMVERVMNEKQITANCVSYDAKCDNEGKEDIVVPFLFFFAKPLLLFLTNIVLRRHGTIHPQVHSPMNYKDMTYQLPITANKRSKRDG
jgi:hypothetical protein